MNTYTRRIASFVRSIREQSGLSIQDFAQAAEIPIEQVHALDNAEAPYKPSHLLALAEQCDLPFLKLIEIIELLDVQAHERQEQALGLSMAVVTHEVGSILVIGRSANAQLCVQLEDLEDALSELEGDPTSLRQIRRVERSLGGLLASLDRLAEGRTAIHQLCGEHWNPENPGLPDRALARTAPKDLAMRPDDPATEPEDLPTKAEPDAVSRASEPIAHPSTASPDTPLNSSDPSPT